MKLHQADPENGDRRCPTPVYYRPLAAFSITRPALVCLNSRAKRVSFIIIYLVFCLFANDINLGLDASIEHTPKKKSMRYNHFMDLFGTESNYVGILHTIVSVGLATFILYFVIRIDLVSLFK